MRVLDSDDQQVGTVAAMKMGDPGAVTSHGQRQTRGPVAGVVDAFLGAEPAVPEQRAEQLLRKGYIKIDAKGFLASDLYAEADELDRVDESGVRLRVPRARLVPKA
ncbi:hypothetical protein [Actinophytocola glycyrrhizae]|uniref:Uncharacterized protein n=1 Tax=Actinophytocola glycyrrhizae TaxID=2044873 RepID=A0ABV9S7Q6_9PSEU